MQKKVSDRDVRREIFKEIKPFLKEKLGKFTHQKIDDNWHFISLGFVRDEMTYVFGINVGFFNKEELEDHYSHVGMNILVRTNGENKDLRLKYNNFFDKYLSGWINKTPERYTSFRGGSGFEYSRMKGVTEFKDEQQMIDFIKESITQINNIYPYIIANPESIFSHVVRAAPPWDETILEIALNLSN